jgi:hypothetical protein
VKKLFIIVAMVISVVLPNVVFAIRWGNDRIQIGDTTFEVQAKMKECGQILDKDVVRRNASGGSYIKIEHGYIRVEERASAYCYPLSLDIRSPLNSCHPGRSYLQPLLSFD